MNSPFGFANLLAPSEKKPPPEWLKALRIYPNAPWVVAQQRRRTAGTHNAEELPPRRAA